MGPRELLLLFLLLGGAAKGQGQSPLWPMAPRHRREEPPPLALRWEPFAGRLPPGAVPSWNRHRNVTEFVCAAWYRGCQPGAFVPARGPFCHFPYAGRECRSAAGAFALLLVVGGQAAPRWVPASFGAVPRGAVACPGGELLVGRAGGALGKVSRGQRAAFAADGAGDELWYKWYEVLAAPGGGR